jgi:hypothetical protein
MVQITGFLLNLNEPLELSVSLSTCMYSTCTHINIYITWCKWLFVVYLTASSVVFWFLTPYRLIGGYQRFGGKYSICLQDWPKIEPRTSRVPSECDNHRTAAFCILVILFAHLIRNDGRKVAFSKPWSQSETSCIPHLWEIDFYLYSVFLGRGSPNMEFLFASQYRVTNIEECLGTVSSSQKFLS